MKLGGVQRFCALQVGLLTGASGCPLKDAAGIAETSWAEGLNQKGAKVWVSSFSQGASVHGGRPLWRQQHPAVHLSHPPLSPHLSLTSPTFQGAWHCPNTTALSGAALHWRLPGVQVVLDTFSPLQLASKSSQPLQSPGQDRSGLPLHSMGTGYLVPSDTETLQNY